VAVVAWVVVWVVAWAVAWAAWVAAWAQGMQELVEDLVGEVAWVLQEEGEAMAVVPVVLDVAVQVKSVEHVV
jgi:hypothetical protein